MTPSWFRHPIRVPQADAMRQAREHQRQLLKPLGALGLLEELVVRLAGLQGAPTPSVDPARMVIFAADHGVAAAGVSAYAQETTAALVRAICAGHGAIAVMARHMGVPLEVVDLGLSTPLEALPHLISQRAGAGTADMRVAPAMRETQLQAALKAGRDAVARAVREGTRLLICGEVGIANSTSAAAITSALLGMPPEALAGPGSGLNEAGMANKAAVITRALEYHQEFSNTPLEVLRRLGGFELAALCGTFVTCGQVGLPAVVDGFAASVAALVAVSLKPSLKEWLLFAHRSAEPGQLLILRTLGARPLLDLDLRLGQGTGAAAALPLLRLACALNNEMSSAATPGATPA